MGSSEQVAVRLARATDVQRLLEIASGAHAASQWKPYEYARYVAEAEDLLQRHLVAAEVDAQVVGFAAASFLSGDECALMGNLAVAEGWRRRGVALALCSAIVDWAQRMGAVGLELEVRESNQGARALYAALGFVEEGRRRKYYAGPEEDGLLMGLRFANLRGVRAL